MPDKNSNDRDSNERFMRECLELAARAQGRTSPNPMVGSVVLDKTGNVVGRGYHHKRGEAHAEVNALNEAGDKAIGGTLFVNLEPCCHHGKTPPCSEKVIASGVKKVVAGMVDPNPVVGGGGLKALKEAGIEVVSGVLESECAYLNRGFVKRIKTGLPWVCLKLATTLDAKIADRHGGSRWITGAEARHYVHELRNAFDAVLIGTNTALIDNPTLNVRDIENSRDPVKVLVDKDLRVSFESKLFKYQSDARTLVITKQENADRTLADLPLTELIGVPYTVMKPAAKSSQVAAGVPFRRADDKQQNRDMEKLDLEEGLRQLVKRGINTVLFEGGGTLAGNMIDENLVDEMIWIVAPKLLQDPLAVPALGGRARRLEEAVTLHRVCIKNFGEDVAYCSLLPPGKSLLSQASIVWKADEPSRTK
ncbi:MAG: bifunctional diaminohydroxyphosphoribosylaminopyrimidine deaminase/5-amino-6-(5-phosphoribosylamino)uracil reductase RibD [Cyanobacteria bacterium DS2.3.42]|nr:bifunctional diaminohydroxyphosphoribosylaminopyrimidine deaminase/5-amino-6-(5-phosphoribosylamino)uracil reductase RibD [Cyanobacteria bacterium DS2.3.42]